MTTEIKNIWQAISVVQAQLPVIDKTAKNDFFKANYTPLDDVVKRVYPILSELSVACSQILETTEAQNCVRVKTVLCHWPSDTKIESTCDMPAVAGKGMQPQHAYGSSISYARRYALTSILGIVCGDEDDDGGVPNQNESQPQNNQGGVKAELENFKQWLKQTVKCETKADLIALFSWLNSTGQLSDVTYQQALTNVQFSRMTQRVLEGLIEADGTSYEVVMENARDHYMRETEGAEVAL